MRRPRIVRHYAEYHRPRFYRCQVAHRGIQVGLNTYGGRRAAEAARLAGAPDLNLGTAWIGLALVLGRYAYCVKWAHARIQVEEVTRGEPA